MDDIGSLNSAQMLHFCSIRMKSTNAGTYGSSSLSSDKSFIVASKDPIKLIYW